MPRMLALRFNPWEGKVEAREDLTRFHSYVMGTRTCDRVPGLNRHLWNVSVVTLSRTRLPVLCAIIALVTFPLAVSISIVQTPLPVILARFAWYGYSGKGALTAKAWAADNDN